MVRKKEAPVVWLKLIGGDEIVAEEVSMNANSITIRRPTLVVWASDTMILSPYYLYSEKRDFTFDRQHVLLRSVVIDSMKKYYEVSLDFACDHQNRFDNTVKRLVNKFEAAILDRDQESLGPKESDLKSIEKEENDQQIHVHDPEEPVPTPARKELVDRVAALAESKGLGKKNEASKKKE